MAAAPVDDHASDREGAAHSLDCTRAGLALMTLSAVVVTIFVTALVLRLA